MRFSVTFEDSVFAEHRKVVGTYVTREVATGYPGVSVTSENVPVKATSDFTIENRPLLFFTPELSGVVVDSTVFPEGLKMIRATHLGPGDLGEVGSIDRHALEQLGGRRLALFLIHSGVIETWVHVGAELELVSESERGGSGGFTFVFRGHHSFFTNEEVVEPLNFSVQIDEGGRIVVRGNEASG